MTQPVPRCDWSDLPNRECVHCHPEQRPAKPVTESEERERLRREAVLALVPGMRVVFPIAHQPATPDEAPHAHLHDVDRESFREADLHDIVVALVEPTRHRQPYTVRNDEGIWVTRRWETSSPALLDQLGSAVEQSSSSKEGPRPGFGSKPSARIDAIDALQRITREAESWLRRLDLQIPYVPGPYGTSSVNLHAAIRRTAANVLVGQDRNALQRDVRSWWILARIVTGWDAPAWRPRNTCPICEAAGGLRIRFDVSIAICLDCDSEWDAQTIGLLADHIKTENDDSGSGTQADAATSA